MSAFLTTVCSVRLKLLTAVGSHDMRTLGSRDGFVNKGGWCLACDRDLACGIAILSKYGYRPDGFAAKVSLLFSFSPLRGRQNAFCSKGPTKTTKGRLKRFCSRRHYWQMRQRDLSTISLERLHQYGLRSRPICVSRRRREEHDADQGDNDSDTKYCSLVPYHKQ